MKKILLILGMLFLISGCSTSNEELIIEEKFIPPEVQKNENGPDHMSVVGQSNMFLNIVGNINNIEIETEEDINYYNDAKGFIAKPTQQGAYPGIVLIHEWWGLNQNIKEVAKTLASEGYIVFAVDLYNGKVAQNSSEARELRISINQDDFYSP